MTTKKSAEKPKKPLGAKRSVSVIIRLTRQERETLMLRAREQNTTASSILRKELDRPEPA